jgi:hypothetical protein
VLPQEEELNRSSSREGHGLSILLERSGISKKQGTSGIVLRFLLDARSRNSNNHDKPRANHLSSRAASSGRANYVLARISHTRFRSSLSATGSNSSNLLGNALVSAVAPEAKYYVAQLSLIPGLFSKLYKVPS